MKNPVMALPRPVWLAVMTRWPELMEDLTVCLPFYMLAGMSGLVLDSLLTGVTHQDWTKPEEFSTWSNIVALGLLCIWLAAPDLFSAFARRAAARLAMRATTGVLLVSLFVAMLTPLLVELVVCLRLRETKSVEVLKGWMKVYFGSSLLRLGPPQFPVYLNTPERVENFQFWDELGRIAGTGGRTRTFDVDRLSESDKTAVVRDLC